MIPANPFPIQPIFQEYTDGEIRDVEFKFYPNSRVMGLTAKVLVLYFLPLILGGILHYGFGVGSAFRLMGSIPWFWIFGIFCMVYLFTGVRCDAYEKPYVYLLYKGKKGKLLGPRSSRSLPFLQCTGLDWKNRKQLEARGFPEQKLRGMYLILLSMLLVSILSTIL